MTVLEHNTLDWTGAWPVALKIQGLCAAGTCAYSAIYPPKRRTVPYGCVYVQHVYGCAHG